MRAVYEKVQGYTKFGMVVVILVPSLISSAGQDLGKKNLPRLTGAALLEGYPPGTLMVTTGDATLELQTGGGDWCVMPSMSANGNLIASARYADLASNVSRAIPMLTVGIYSMIDKRWRDYPSLETQGGSIAISADGSKLAYVTRSTAPAQPHIQFMDLATGAVSIGPETTRLDGHISWSPDGRRITFDRETEVERSVNGKPISPPTAIFVFDVETGTVSKIADGMSPTWSPSGEWIAFYDYWPDRDNVKKGWYPANDNHVSVIHPDGTGHKVLVTFRPDESLSVPSVWSPDSQSILINKPHDPDKGTMDIFFLDITTQKLTRKFGNVPPIYAWVVAK